MATLIPATIAPSLFTSAEWDALRMLRVRYRQGRDLFSTMELERLRFLRWLYSTGRLAP